MVVPALFFCACLAGRCRCVGGRGSGSAITPRMGRGPRCELRLGYARGVDTGSPPPSTPVVIRAARLLTVVASTWAHSRTPAGSDAVWMLIGF